MSSQPTQPSQPTKEEVIRELSKCLGTSFSVTYDANRILRVRKSGSYKFSLDLQNLQFCDGTHNIKFYNAPKDFIRAVQFYLKYGTQFPYVRKYSNAFNWNTAVQRLISHMWLFRDVVNHGIKQVFFVDPRKYKDRDEFTEYIEKVKIGKFRIVAYYYSPGDWRSMYGRFSDEDINAVQMSSPLSDICNKHLEFLLKDFSDKHSNRDLTERDMRLFKLVEERSFKVDEFAQLLQDLTDVKDVSLEQYCANILGTLDEFIEEVKMDTFDGYQFDEQTIQLISPPKPVEEPKPETVNPTEAKQTDSVSSTSKQIDSDAEYEIVAQPSQPSQSAKPEESSQSAKPEEPNQPSQSAELNLKEKYQLTDEQFSKLSLVLSLPQPDPEKFNIDEIVEQIKNNTNTGWAILSKIHNKVNQPN